MKKLLTLLIFILVITLSGCSNYKEKQDKDFICEITYYGDTFNSGVIKVDELTFSKASTWVKIDKMDGDFILMDLTQVSILCEELMEETNE